MSLLQTPSDTAFNIKFVAPGAKRARQTVENTILAYRDPTSATNIAEGDGIDVVTDPDTGITTVSSTGVLGIAHINHGQSGPALAGDLTFVAGTGIAITNPVEGALDIANTGVTTFNTLTGDVGVTAGTGISINVVGHNAVITNSLPVPEHVVNTVDTMDGAIAFNAGDGIAINSANGVVSITNTNIAPGAPGVESISGHSGAPLIGNVLIDQGDGTLVSQADQTITVEVDDTFVEVVSRKAIDLSTPDDVKYPTTLAVSTALSNGLSSKEDVSNKATNLTNPDDTKYPTTLAVDTAITDSIASREDTSNKAIDLANPDDIKYPSTLAVSTAISNSLSSKEDTSNKAIDLANPDDIKYPSTLAVSTAISNSLSSKEDVSNKATNLTNPDDIKYPTTLTVSTALSSKENVTNKSVNLTSPDNTKYPTTLAVSTALGGYVPNTGNSTIAGDKTFTGAVGAASLSSNGGVSAYAGAVSARQTAGNSPLSLQGPASAAGAITIRAQAQTTNRIIDIPAVPNNASFVVTESSSTQVVNSTIQCTNLVAQGGKVFSKQGTGYNNVALEGPNSTVSGNLVIGSAVQAVDRRITVPALSADTTFEIQSNKATNLTSPDDTKYPTTLAVSTAFGATEYTAVTTSTLPSSISADFVIRIYTTRVAGYTKLDLFVPQITTNSGSNPVETTYTFETSYALPNGLSSFRCNPYAANFPLGPSQLVNNHLHYFASIKPVSYTLNLSITLDANYPSGSVLPPTLVTCVY